MRTNASVTMVAVLWILRALTQRVHLNANAREDTLPCKMANVFVSNFQGTNLDKGGGGVPVSNIEKL